jgi:amino acid adenylation domain-containing protein
VAGGALEGQLSYWRERLAGAPALLELPTDRPRPAVQSFRGAKHLAHIPAEVARRVVALGRRERVTLYMMLLAAFEALLSRYTGQEDIVVGTDIANRTREELEGLIGFFVNMLTLRVDLSGEPTFSELVGRVREVCLGAYANQDVPFERLVEELRPERSLSHNPLYQVVFTYTDAPAEGLSLPGLKASVDEGLSNGSSKFDLNLIVLPQQGGEEGVHVVWEYNTDLFDATTIERMASHYATLLAAAADDHRRKILELPLLTEEELRRTLVEWNQTQADFPTGALAHELFEEQARRAPDATAAVCEGSRMSYAELNRRANRLARALVEQGLAAEDVVGLLARRGFDFLTAVLAVFKAGGVYLPLDPGDPHERTRQILEQSGAKLLLAGAEFAGADSGGRARFLSIESLLRRQLPEENLGRRSDPDNLAYVIYTSGSTGAPKGAMVEHHGMLNHLLAKVADLGLTSGDRIAQNALQCFDISVWQMLAPLVVGGSVLVVAEEVARDPVLLLGEVGRGGVTILEVVPSLLRGLLEVGARPAPTSLRRLVVTGEALPPELCREWLATRPEVPLLNAYGPTECSDDVTHYLIERPPTSGVARMPIGRPVANMRMYVLDRRLRPVAVGVPGELCVGGTGVGRGYLRDPKRTAEVFVPDPFSPEPGARLYRTGDSVRWLADGSLEFIGRLDHQVKIRGHRIELGEIEAALRAHESVSAAVVVAREEAGDKRLVAYVVGAGVTALGLRAGLKERLPKYMIPSSFVMLDELPLTPNGKVDRKALPAPDSGQAGAEYVAPRTDVEEAIASIWSELLGVSRVGVNDNFFDLGGHSILAMQLAARVHNAFGVRLPLRTVFESPTVAGLTVAVAVVLLGGEESKGMEGMLERLERLSDGEIRALLDDGELEVPRLD